MGVPLNDWLATIARHPRSFKFEGLDGFHTDVREAAAGDEGFMNRHIENEVDFHAKQLDEQLPNELLDMPPAEALAALKAREGDTDYATRYIAWLIESTDADDVEADATVEDYEEADRHNDRRRQWVGMEANEDEPHVHHEYIRTGDGNEEWLLQEHPPVEVLSHASGQGVAVEDVLFFCPSCGREPAVWEDERTDGRFYCGFCGGESAIDSDQDLSDFLTALDVELWPLRIGEDWQLVAVGTWARVEGLLNAGLHPRLYYPKPCEWTGVAQLPASEVDRAIALLREMSHDR